MPLHYSFQSFQSQKPHPDLERFRWLLLGFDLLAFVLATRWTDDWSTAVSFSGVAGSTTAFLVFYVCRSVARPHLERLLAEKQIAGVTFWNWLLTGLTLFMVGQISPTVSCENLLAAIHAAFLFSIARWLAIAILVLFGFSLMVLLGSTPLNPAQFLMHVMNRFRSGRSQRPGTNGASGRPDSPAQPKYKPEQDRDNQGPIIDV